MHTKERVNPLNSYYLIVLDIDGFVNPLCPILLLIANCRSSKDWRITEFGATLGTHDTLNGRGLLTARFDLELLYCLFTRTFDLPRLVLQYRHILLHLFHVLGGTT